MKFDPDVARQILKAMEAHNDDELPFKTNLLPDLDDAVYHFHCRMLSEAEVISVYEVRLQGGPNYYFPRELKWAGVQFLQMFEDEALWNRAKSEAASKGVGMALDTLMGIGTELVKRIVTSQVGFT